MAGRWSPVVSAFFGAAIGMGVAAWPALRYGQPVPFDQLLLYAAVGAAVFVILAIIRNAFA